MALKGWYFEVGIGSLRNMCSSPGFADILPQDTVDSGKVLHHFIFRRVGWAYSDTAFFPSANANLKSESV